MANSLINGVGGISSPLPEPPDSRVWMYRGTESKLFNSKEEVPPGEGWSETPTAEPAAPVSAPEPEAAPVETHDDVSEIDALRAEAIALGIEVDGRWGLKKLKLMIEAAKADGNGD